MDLDAPPVLPADEPAAAPPGPDTTAPAPGASSPRADIDRAVEALAGVARGFARTAPREKAALLRTLVPRLLAAAPGWAAATARLRGLDPESPAAIEAWLGGPVPAIGYARRLAEALDDIASAGRPALSVGDLGKRADGRLIGRLVPRAWAERLAQRGRATAVAFVPGTEAEDVIAGQAAFYRAQDPEGGVAAVHAAGSDAAAGVLDALFSLFVEGRVALLALPTEAASLAPLLTETLAPLVERGFLHVAVAADEARAHLDGHPGVATHLRAAPGSVNPVIVVPCLYAKNELAFVAASLAAQLAHGAGLDPAAPRVLVVPASWPQRRLFLGMLEQALTRIPPRRAYLPGGASRFAALTEGRPGAVRIGSAAPDAPPPWTLLPELDPRADEPLFQATEGAGPVLGVVPVAGDDPVAMLAASTAFCNDRLAGALSAQLVMHPIHEEDPEVSAAVERAVLALRRGAVGVNAWPALLRWAGAAPWGPHGGPLRNDARMLPRVDKAVIEGPLLGRKPAYHPDHPGAVRLAARLASFAAAPRMGHLWTVAGR